MRIRPLKGYGAFDAVMRRGRRFTRGPVGLTLHTTVVPETPTAEIRVGVSVGKRTARSAVMRVRLRRLLREAARSVIERHSQELRTHHVSALILVWRQAPSHPRKIGLGHVAESVEAVVLTALSTLDAEILKGAR